MTDIQNFDELYPGRFIKAGMFNGHPATFTIKAVQHDMLEGDKGVEQKVVLSFNETPFEHVLPKVNAVCIKAMFGAQVTEWVGKRVTFYGTTGIMPFPKKKDEPCVRVYGSPDITEEIRCEFNPPRRKAVVQILKPTQSQVFTTIMASIAAAADNAPWEKSLGKAKQLLSEGTINDREHTEIEAAIQRRIQQAAPTQGQQSTAAEQQAGAAAEPAEDDAGNEGSVRPVKQADPATAAERSPASAHPADGGDGQAAVPQDATADAGEPAETPAQHDLDSDPLPAAGDSPAEPAASPDLKLRDRQQLIRSANALAPERKTEFLVGVSLESTAQLKTQAHADAFTQFVSGQ